MKEKNMTTKQYVGWLSELSRTAKSPHEKRVLLPGIVLESPRNHELTGLAQEIFQPLQQYGLFRFSGESMWVDLVCGSWDQLEHMLPLLARRMVEAAGLYGSFRGGVVVDMRWCEGPMHKGELKELERFLLATQKELSPLILTAPGIGDLVRREMGGLDLQVLVARQEELAQLKWKLNQMEGLTSEEKMFVKKRMEQESLEAAAAMLRTVQRMTALSVKTEGVNRLLNCFSEESSVRTCRPIGFERG